MTKVTQIRPGTVRPSRKLGEHGQRLWTSMLSAQNIKHPVHVEMLTNACQQLDRAESLREQIEKDGETIVTKGGLKDHPCLRHEAAARSFVSRTVHRLAQETGPPASKLSPVYYDLERMRERERKDDLEE